MANRSELLAGSALMGARCFTTSGTWPCSARCPWASAARAKIIKAPTAKQPKILPTPLPLRHLRFCILILYYEHGETPFVPTARAFHFVGRTFARLLMLPRLARITNFRWFFAVAN